VKESKALRNIGLARALSKLGYSSRSRAAELIRSGRVSVSGKVARDPEMPVSGTRHPIAVDGKVIEPRKKIYLIMNKPRGVVTTASDEKGRATVYSVLGAQEDAEDKDRGKGKDKAQHWVAPVGRLDKASEGLLLLTNDSAWGARITDPQTHLNKTYHVQLATVADEPLIQQLIRGVTTKDGDVLRAKQACLLRAGHKNCWIEIVLDEGRNRQIRRTMQALGVEVLRLIRVAIGPLQLGDLAKGQYRPLTAEEKRMLDRALRVNS
jgi:23S rRNA pseudouridine2605 synthase